MPVIEVHLLEGYRPEDRRRLGECLTDAVRMVVPAPPEAVTVMIHEMPENNYYRGRTTRIPAPALPDPCAIVDQFLAHLAARDLQAAAGFLSDNAVLQFPGSPPMHTLEALIEWSIPRYRSIAKHMEGTEAFQSAGDASIVFCRGTLSGQWPDGSPFNNVRFVDRFELVNGKITRQDVWNDLAEARTSTAHEKAADEQTR